MHREVPGVEAHWIEDQTHAFCVSTQQSGAEGRWRPPSAVVVDVSPRGSLLTAALAFESCRGCA